MLELLLAAEAQARGGHLMQVSYALESFFLLAACYLLPAACCLLPAACCLLPAILPNGSCPLQCRGDDMPVQSRTKSTSNTTVISQNTSN
jgi:hypothetical protein